MKIIVKTYEESRLEFFKDLARKAEKKLDKCIKAMKKSDYNSPLSEAQLALDDAVEKKGFYCDIVDMLCTDKKAGWISVNDRLPEKAGQYLIFTSIHFVPDHVDECDHYEGVEISSFSPHYGFYSENGHHAKFWMPLPELPKESENDNERR